MKTLLKILSKIVKWCCFMMTTILFMIYSLIFIAIWHSEGVLEAISTIVGAFKLMF